MVKKVVELTIHSEFKDEPIIYNIIKNFRVVINIIEASFSSEMGWAILSVEGEEQDLEDVFSYLDEKGTEIIFR